MKLTPWLPRGSTPAQVPAREWATRPASDFRPACLVNLNSFHVTARMHPEGYRQLQGQSRGRACNCVRRFPIKIPAQDNRPDRALNSLCATVPYSLLFSETPSALRQHALLFRRNRRRTSGRSHTARDAAAGVVVAHLQLAQQSDGQHLNPGHNQHRAITNMGPC
jgi:hypothetical protein